MLPRGTIIKGVNIKDKNIIISTIVGYSDVTNNYKLSDGFNMSNDLKIRGFNPKKNKSYIMYECSIYKPHKRYKRRYKRK